MNPKSRATVELLGASLLWGFGFVATVWALEGFSPVGFLLLRFALALFAGEVLRLLFFKTPFWNRLDFRISFPAGILMSFFLLPQTIGLLFTTATHSGFLTILYVVLVPILSFFLLKKRFPLSVYALSLTAFLGAWLLMGGHGSEFNQGDLWTLLCALMAALHILYVGHVAPQIQNPFRFNHYQSFWCFVSTSPFIFFDSHFQILSDSLKSWSGVLFTAIGSSVIGFFIQIRAQKVLSETTSAQLFLLESPFALIFGYALLNERISGIQFLGAIILLVSSFATLKLEHSAGSPKSKDPKSEPRQIP